MATPTAVMRWAGETSPAIYDPSVEAVLFLDWVSVAPELAEGLNGDELEKRDVG